MDLGGLNAQQRRAVEHGQGPALVVAGAGTGKTRVITTRIAHLIHTEAAKAQEILALTFTEKAAREMSERLYEQIGWQSYAVSVLTFNAFGSELLGRYASHVGRSVRGGLINDTQKAILLQRHLGRVTLSYYGPHTNIFEFLEGIVTYIGQLKNAGITATQFAKYVDSRNIISEVTHPMDILEQRDVSALYSLYEAIKAETGTYDYHDQLEVPLNILQQKPNIAERLARQYTYVLVDEYQDTNSLQDELLRAFIPPTGNLFAVGDDDQAIYGFRGAQVGNILDFVDHFRVDKPIALTQNYRSGQSILDASYRLIQHNNPDRLEAKLNLDKRLIAQNTDSTIDFQPYNTAADEIIGTVEAIKLQIQEGTQPGAIAILSATHAPLGLMAKQLRLQDIPYALSTKVNIFEQPELNQLWYLLEWIGWRVADESLAHIMISRFIGWESNQYRQLLSEAKTRLVGPEEALGLLAAEYGASNPQIQEMAPSEPRGHTEPVQSAQTSLDQLFETTTPVLPSELGETAHNVMSQLALWRQLATTLPISQLVFKLFFETGVSDALRHEAETTDNPRIIRVFEDVGRLLDQMQDFEGVAQDATLAGYLAAFPKPPEIEVSEPQGDDGGVQLLTVHASKGLEFDTVHLIGCTQRSWSGGRGSAWEIPVALTSGPELPPEHEQRRLLYVAVTRAKQRMVVSAGTHTAGGIKQSISPLIHELFGQKILLQNEQRQSDNSQINIINKLQQYYPLKADKSTTKLPFETSDGWLELAVGDIANYDFCPYDFYLEKVLGIRQPFGPQLAFGTAVHGAIQAYYDAILRGEQPAEAELQDRLGELWSDKGYDGRQQAETAKQQAQSAVHTFFMRQKTIDKAIKGTEFSIRLEVPEVKLRLKGRIDAFFETEDGVELRDFKTGRKTDAAAVEKAAKNSIQLRSYALAYKQMTGEDVGKVTLDYVVTGVEGSVQLSAKILQNHERKLADIADAIRARQFAPKPSNVHQCAAIRYYGNPENEVMAGA